MKNGKVPTLEQNIIDEQRDELKDTLEEYPAMAISLADKLLRMLGLADTTSVKKL